LVFSGGRLLDESIKIFELLMGIRMEEIGIGIKTTTSLERGREITETKTLFQSKPCPFDRP